MSNERDLVAGVIQLANLLIKRLGPVFGKAGVTPQQWAVLSVISSSDAPLSPSLEVAAAFWMPVARLRDPASTCDATVVVRGEERRVASFRHGEHVIWGLTERILRQFVSLLG